MSRPTRDSAGVALVVPGPRPLLRGVSHQVAFFVALVAGGVLIASAPTGRPRLVAVIYSIFLAGMFGVSALLHRRDWTARPYAWLRRADHAMIFACIAGTYTPFCVLAVPQPAGFRLLTLVWIAAGVGIARAAFWPHAPRAITATLFVAVGWVAAVYFPDVYAGLDGLAFTMLMAGGALFTVGAVVYLLKTPDPWPTVFGYHEIMHVMVILGCACHFVTIVRVIR